MKARILTIGTEICTGEIVNSNAAWISMRLEDKAHLVWEHISVRDDRAACLSALGRAGQGELLIVTGGLGPTSDDITREIMAEWSGQPLEFSTGMWDGLVQDYARRGLQIRESHRHQCYFPKGAKILRNPVGTAHGFRVQKGDIIAYVLPGPPRELEGMWNQEVEPRLSLGEAARWTYWSVIGMPESEVAELIEPIIASKNLEVGYRASVPYVHVKIRGPVNVEAEVDRVLKSNLVQKGKVDFVEQALLCLPAGDLLIQDQLTRGMLSARVQKSLGEKNEIELRIEECSPEQDFLVSGVARVLQVRKVEEDLNSFDLVWKGENSKQERITLPFRSSVLSERGRKSVAEWALVQWSRWVSE